MYEEWPQKPSVMVFYQILLLATCFGFWKSRHQAIKNIRQFKYNPLKRAFPKGCDLNFFKNWSSISRNQVNIRVYIHILRASAVHNNYIYICEGHLESKERFAIKKYLLIIGKKKNVQVLSHTFTYFSTQSSWTLRHLAYRDTSLLIPSSYQKAAWPNVHKFCGIANVW